MHIICWCFIVLVPTTVFGVELGCPTLPMNTISVKATCADSDLKDIPCTAFVPATTVAKLDCKVGYIKPDDHFTSRIHCRRDGQWSSRVPFCIPRCGEVSSGVPLISYGNVASISQVPWHVGIYESLQNRFEQICGGTIISVRAVLSAAHCFWDPVTNKQKPASLYTVVAGKTIRDYYTSEQNMQKLDVGSILIPEGYLGDQNSFVGDLAVVKLSSSIIYHNRIVPICIKYEDNAAKEVAEGLVGRVAGWGVTEKDVSSPVLKIIDLKAVNYWACKQKSESSFLPYITPDKFCAHRENENVCVGDSGGGFTEAQQFGNTIKYYLRGLVSVGSRLQQPSCYSNETYTTFTNVLYYERWFSKYTNDDYFEESTTDFKMPSAVTTTPEKCSIPVIENGHVRSTATQKVLPSQTTAQNGERLEFVCDKNWILTGERYTYCIKGSLLNTPPLCTKSCSRPADTLSVKTTCTDQDSNPMSCNLECKEGYRTPDGPFVDQIYCRPDGQWNSPLSSCTPKFGEVIGDTNTTLAPWQATIYWKEFWQVNEVTNLCQGTIISARAVLTAAHCFYDKDRGERIDSVYVVVAEKAGEPGRQKLQVDSITVHPDFNNTDWKTSIADIAVIKLKEPIIFHENLVPICILNSFDEKDDLVGVSGRVTGPDGDLKLFEWHTFDHEWCKGGLPKELPQDKFCVKSSDKKWGNFGAGFAVEKTQNGLSKFFLRGVVTQFFFDPSIFTMVTSLTNVLNYIDFIDMYS